MDCRWVEFKCMRGAGLPIEALVEYVSLFQQGDETIEARLAILTEQRNQLAARVQEIQTTMERLDYKIEKYDKIIMPAERKLAL